MQTFQKQQLTNLQWYCAYITIQYDSYLIWLKQTSTVFSLKGNFVDDSSIIWKWLNILAQSIGHYVKRTAFRFITSLFLDCHDVINGTMRQWKLNRPKVNSQDKTKIRITNKPKYRYGCNICVTLMRFLYICRRDFTMSAWL